MAKGYDKHQERLEALNTFGRRLARRSGSRCELCGAAGVTLTVFEVSPIPTEPVFEQCTLICQTCRDQIENPKMLDSKHWRCLYEAIWSEVPAVQVMAVRLLRQLADKEVWAIDLLDQVYLTEEVQVWADELE